MLKTISPDTLRIKIGECVDRLMDRSMKSSQRTGYTLKITAKPYGLAASDDDLLPLPPPTTHSPASSPEHMEWLCMSADVGGDKGCFIMSNN